MKYVSNITFSLIDFMTGFDNNELVWLQIGAVIVIALLLIETYWFPND